MNEDEEWLDTRRIIAKELVEMNINFYRFSLTVFSLTPIVPMLFGLFEKEADAYVTFSVLAPLFSVFFLVFFWLRGRKDYERDMATLDRIDSLSDSEITQILYDHRD